MKAFKLSVGDKAYKVDIEKFDGKHAQVKVDGKPYNIEVKQAEDQETKASAVSMPAKPVIQKAAPSAPEPPQAPPVRAAQSGGEVKAPMPGLILEIMVAVGDQVEAGKPVVKMEAMKMENEIPASVSGTVKTITCKVGDNVSTDETLMVMDEV